MKKKFIHVGKRTLSVVLSIMMIVSTMLIGTITSVSAFSITNATFYFVKPDGWNNEPRLSIGSDKRRMMMKSTGNIDKKIYIFNGINFNNYDGYFFADVSWECDEEDGNYYHSSWKVANSTDKITGESSGYLYKLNSGTSGAVTGTNDLNDSISVKVYLKSGDTFEENSSIASASASGKKIDNTTSTTEAAKYSSPTFTTTANDSSSYSFVGWYDSTNENLVSENATYKLPELTTDTELHAVYEATTSGVNLMTTAGASSTSADGSKIGTFSIDGTLTFSPSSSGTYYLYVDNGEKWFNSSNAFDSNNSVVLHDYTDNNFKHTIKFEYEAGKTYTFKWESPYNNDSKQGLLSYTVSGTPVTSYNITASAYDNTKGTVTVDDSPLAPSGQTTTSSSSISIAVTPTTGNVIQSLSIGGKAITLKETEKTGGYTNSSYSISGDTAIDVVFAASSQPVGNAPFLHKYATTASGDGSIASSGATDLLNVAMTYYTDSNYTYYYYDITDGGKYLYNITLDGVTYYKGNTTTYENSVYMNNSYSGFTDIFETGHNVSHYYIIYTPSLAADQRISVVTELPNSSASKTYKVTMEQGITSRRDGAQLGSSYLDGVTTQTTVAKSVEELTVTFTTQTVNVENPTYNDLELGYTGYMYQVYGYSILMQVYNDDGTTTSTRVASVVNNLINSSGLKPISNLGNGLYTCEYTFPSNIKSATVTPVFTVSDNYASDSDRDITFTAVYLKMNPGKNLFANTYEPKYYTWRAEKSNQDRDDGEPMFIQKGNKVLEREPEGAYGGQKMLSVGTDMYLAYVQSDLYGILFDDNGQTVQTFDYNEFIKLQQLGYNNITFEPKGDGSTETVASGLDSTYKDYGTKVYTAAEQENQTATSISDTDINAQFELDVDIEGYYIDVFGNRLQDASGNDIKRSALLAESSATTVVAELTALLEKTGKTNKLFGARYGAQDRKNTITDYGMQYAIYNYYVDGTTMKLISQQVSGYGTIEGAIGPNSSSMTNAAYMNSLSTPMSYRVGTASSNEKKSFESGYELIPETYKGVPYLVSYKLKSTGNRIDGKWYYMSRTPQVTVAIKTSVVDENGKLVMSGGKIVENNAGGTATLNYESQVVIDQGTSAVMRAYPNYENNYAFVGFYEENGDFISTANPYSDKVFAIDTTVYAVFKPVSKDTVTVTNNIYRSAKPNPQPGGGNGKVSVELIITPWTSQVGAEYVYGDPVTYSGDTSSSSSVSATIRDGDKYKIVLKGQRSGVDEFIAFRISDKDKNKNLYYIALDDLDCLTITKDNNIPVSAEYTTHENVWYWSEHTGTSAVLDYYTDFRKVSSYATLNYEYQNRDYEWRTYTVKNVPLNYDEVQRGNFVPTNDVILKYAPPIDEVFQNCVWEVTENKIIRGNSVATLTATQSGKKYTTYIDNKSSLTPDKVESSFNGTLQLTAEETHDNKTFSYWMRYPVDTNGNPIYDSGEIFSYMCGASVKVTFNSYFEAIYGETGDKYFTNVQDPVYTREKYTDSNGTTDYVYADLLVQFDTSDPKLTFADIVNNSNGEIKFGIALERDTKAEAYDGGKITAPETNVKAPVSTTIQDLYDKGATKGWNSTTNKELAQYNYYYYLYDLTALADDLSAFGRYNYYLRFVNNESNRSKIYNVYSYIIYKDETGVDQIVVSKPTVLSIYATGIKNDGSTTS